MPLKVLDVVKNDIDAGYINWEKLQRNLFAALDSIKGNFNKVELDAKLLGTDNVKPLKFEDALIFTSNTKYGKMWCKLFYVRVKLGVLYCSGVQYGKYDSLGKMKAVIPYREF